jgi:hypothetical protein
MAMASGLPFLIRRKIFSSHAIESSQRKQLSANRADSSRGERVVFCGLAETHIVSRLRCMKATPVMSILKSQPDAKEICVQSS